MSVILCTAGYDHTIRFWEALSGICSRTIQHPESQVNRLCITPDKRFLAVAGRHNIRLYDATPTKGSNTAQNNQKEPPLVTFEGHTNNITAVAFHADCQWMVSSSEDCTVRIWNTKTGTMQREYKHSHAVNDVVIHPNQGEIISGDRGGNIRVFDLGKDRCTHQLVPAEDVSVQSISVASDGSVLVAGNNAGDVYIWRIYQEENETALAPCRYFHAHNQFLTRLLLSPDIKLLATCSADHTVKIWAVDPMEENLEALDEEDYQAMLPFEPPQSNFQTLPNINSQGLFQPQNISRSQQSMSPHHPILAARRPLPLLTTLGNHQRWVWDCAFSADSAYLVTVCSDHYARLWELATATVIRQYTGHHRGAVCVALNDYSGSGGGNGDRA